MRGHWALLSAVALSASSLSAQDGSEASAPRTVEGAQKFLSEFYAQGDARAKVMGYVNGGHWSQVETPGRSTLISRRRT